ncbi:MAG: hypothetical protein K2Q20_09455, partial [Phycisphaerales bacterium]|nr:hypothetical protein [Phycisphaerales bacterium]
PPAAGTQTPEQAVAAERARVAAIESRAGGLAAVNPAIATLASEAKSNGWSPQQFSDAAVLAMAPAPTSGTPANPSATGLGPSLSLVADERDKRVGAMTMASVAQYMPDAVAALTSEDPRDNPGRGERVAEALGFASVAEARAAIRSAQASPFGRRRLWDVATSCAMRAHGCSSIDALHAKFSAYGPQGIFAAAMHTTSDFPQLLSNLANKRLASAYVEAPTVWQQFCARGTASDYKDQTVINLSEGQNLELIAEGQTPSEFTLNEKASTIAVKPYGRRGSFTFQMLRNDDLGGFLRLGQVVGQAARRLPDSLFFGLLNLNSGAGPTMPDGNALFSSAHNNTLTAAAISDVSLDLAYQKMANQKGIGKDKDLADELRPIIEAIPDRLLVHTSRFTTARAWFVNQFKVGGNNNEANMVASMFRPVASARVGGVARWYAFADPASLPVFQINFLDGQEGVTSTPIHDGDPLAFRVQYTAFGVGAAAVDWYGAAFNSGL